MLQNATTDLRSSPDFITVNLLGWPCWPSPNQVGHNAATAETILPDGIETVLTSHEAWIPWESPATFTVPKEIYFPRYNMKCSGENVILRGKFHVLGFPLHFMLYRGNLDCFSSSAELKILFTPAWYWRHTIFITHSQFGNQIIFKGYPVLIAKVFFGAYRLNTIVLYPDP